MIETKYFEETFELVRNICEDKVVSCIGLPFVLSLLKIEKNDDGEYILLGETPYTNNIHRKTTKLLKFQLVLISGKKYIVEESYIISLESDFAAPITMAKLQIKLTKVRPINTQKNTTKYHRFIVPCENAENWMSDICTYGYNKTYTNNVGETRCFSQRGVFQFSVRNNGYEVFPYKNGNDTYLVIDSLNKCTEQEISDVYQAVGLTLNWLLGIKSGGVVHIVSSQNKRFNRKCYLVITNRAIDIKNNYPIFTTNMYSLWNYLEAKRIKTKACGKLKGENGKLNQHLQDWLHEDELSRMINLIYENSDLARALYICISASSAPLEYQPALLSVALETLTTYFELRNPEKSKTILSKEEWKPICETLIVTLKQQGLSNDIYEKLEARIRADINRQFNSDKLSRPFELVHYDLTESESNTIGQRNDFLHGRLESLEIEKKRIKGKLPPKSIDDEYQDLITTSVILYRLCSVLLLKLSDYKGYIINHLLFYYPHSPKNEKIVIKI